MISAHWPTWNRNSYLNKQWADIVFKQGVKYRDLLTAVTQESMLISNLFKSWVGSTSGRTLVASKPRLIGEQILLTTVDDCGEVLLLGLLVANVRI